MDHGMDVQEMDVEATEEGVLPQIQSGESASTFTLKAFVAGAFLSFCIGIGPLYGNMVLRGSYTALDFSTAAAIFLFFVFVGVVNFLLELTGRSFFRSLILLAGAVLSFILFRVASDLTLQGYVFFLLLLLVAGGNVLAAATGRPLALNRGELLVTYVMMIVACSIPTMGLTEYLLPVLPGAYYYATPENDWANLIHPYIPSWIAPQNPEWLKYFYEGAPKGFSIPWGLWIRPLAYWILMLAALYFAMICMMVILRKQWVEKERLIYPMVQVPLEMIKEEPGSLLRPFFRNPAMWIGFAIPFIVGCVKALHNYYNFIPTINLSTSIPIFRRTTNILMNLSFPMVGFSYFINTDIAFGLWVFNYLAKIHLGIFNILGIESTENLDIYGIPWSPTLAHQGMGAMIVLALFGLWIARGHLKDVFRKAFTQAPDVDDSDEILSYRTAVWGTIVSLVVMWIWIWRSGMPLWIVPIFLFGSFVLFIGITRIVAEGGVAAARAPLIPSGFVISGVGCSALGPTGLIAIAFSYIWVADIRTFVMASVANGLKLGQGLGRRRSPLFWAIVIAIVVSFVSSAWIILKLSYAYGGINLNGWFFGGGPRAPFEFVSTRLATPTPVNETGWLWTGIGAAFMALLMLARHRFLWWPLHPLGFPISAIGMTNYIAFSVFLAWLIKTVVLKYGGPKLYRATRPFFLGLILGQFVVAGMWLIIDYFTGMTDNNIYWV